MSAEFNSAESRSYLKTYKAELILLLVTFSWGLSFPLIKVSLNSISPFFFLSIRFFITVLLFFIIFRRSLDLSVFYNWSKGIILGLFLFSGFAFQTIGLKYTTASKSAFITGTALIMIPFIQYFVLRSKPKPENIIGGILVMAGLYILSEAYFIVPNFGDLLTLICALSFAIHIVLLNKYSTGDNFYYLSFGMFLTMSVLSILFTFISEILINNELFIKPDPYLIFSLIYTSIVSTLISIILITKYQQETTPLRAGIIYNMESIFTVFFAFILLGEILNFNQIIGAFIMITGLMISEFYGFINLKLTDESKD